MANVKPLKLDSNKTKQFLSTDTIATNNLGTGTANSTTFLRGDQTWQTVGGGGSSIKQVEIDFGVIPVYGASFLILDAAITSSSKIQATIAYDAPTGKDVDEIEMDNLYIICGGALSGQFNMFITTADGSYLADKFKINYTNS